MSRYNTNLAAEFWVLSMLHRLGADAALTLGNKKAVDIVITEEGQPFRTVDVKGLAGSYDWPADNIRLPGGENHFYVFLSFEGKIGVPDAAPSVWIIPASELRPFVKEYPTRTVVVRARVRSKGQRFEQAWWQLTGADTP